MTAFFVFFASLPLIPLMSFPSLMFFPSLAFERGGGGARFVTRAKKLRSVFKGGQGRVPRRPMPREGVVATIRVRGGRWRGGGIEVDGGGGDMVGWRGREVEMRRFWMLYNR